MKTSYYAKSGNNKNAVAISAKIPEFYKGTHCLLLAPSWSIFKEWKYSNEEDSIKDERYIKRFKNEILSKLNPFEVFNELGENAILLCYEKPGKFCHRHIVAEWLSDSLDIVIEEL